MGQEVSLQVRLPQNLGLTGVRLGPQTSDLSQSRASPLCSVWAALSFKCLSPSLLHFLRYKCLLTRHPHEVAPLPSASDFEQTAPFVPSLCHLEMVFAFSVPDYVIVWFVPLTLHCPILPMLTIKFPRGNTPPPANHENAPGGGISLVR